MQLLLRFVKCFTECYCCSKRASSVIAFNLFPLTFSSSPSCKLFCVANILLPFGLLNHTSNHVNVSQSLSVRWNVNSIPYYVFELIVYLSICSDDITATAVTEQDIDALVWDAKKPFPRYYERPLCKEGCARDDLKFEAKQRLGPKHQDEIRKIVDKFKKELLEYAGKEKQDPNAVLFCAGWYEWTFPYNGRLQTGTSEHHGKTGKRNSYNQFVAENFATVRPTPQDQDVRAKDNEQPHLRDLRWKQNACRRLFKALDPDSPARLALEERTANYNRNNGLLLDLAGNNMAESKYSVFNVRRQQDQMKRIGKAFEEDMVAWVCSLWSPFHQLLTGHSRMFSKGSITTWFVML